MFQWLFDITFPWHRTSLLALNVLSFETLFTLHRMADKPVSTIKNVWSKVRIFINVCSLLLPFQNFYSDFLIRNDPVHIYFHWSKQRFLIISLQHTVYNFSTVCITIHVFINPLRSKLFRKIMRIVISTLKYYKMSKVFIGI